MRMCDGRGFWETIEVDKYWKQEFKNVIDCSRDKNDDAIGAQQHPEEMEGFLKAVKKALPKPEDRATALEIGLFKGATHVIWRNFFKSVATVEMVRERVSSFAGGMTEGSTIFLGDSGSPVTARMVGRELGSVDMLFIDGGHRRNEVEADYFNYEPLVRKGGIIGFHDSKQAAGVVEFLEELESGHPLLENPVKITRIHHSTGIAYLVKDWE